MACWTTEQENRALGFLTELGPATALEIAVEVGLEVGKAERMLAAMIRAGVVDAVPLYRIRPLVKASEHDGGI